MKNYNNFKEWFAIKPIIHYKQERPFFNEGEVWMVNMGVNIGYEVNGKNTKGEDFLRPMLIIRKLSHTTFIAIPLTGKEKVGSWFYPLPIKGKKGSLLFNQVQHCDAKRLKYRMERVDENHFLEIKSSFKKFL